ncbi:MAG: alpha/beta hydrolase [Granulosicoccus sp.]|nr:alpha/beta hydrolase [Granulosicoccus sp.]
MTLTNTVQAETISVTVGDLSSALENRAEEPDAVQGLVLDHIQERFDQQEIGIAQGELVYQESISNKTVEGGCNRTIILGMQTTIRLNSDTRFSVSVKSLHDPIIFNVDLDAFISAAGRARQIVGFRLGECQDIARDSFDFSATGPVALSLTLSIELNPEFIDETTLRISPSIEIDGELDNWALRSDVDDSVFRALLEQLLQSEVEKTLGPDRIEAELTDLQSVADDWLLDAIPDGFLDVELPEADDEQIVALYELLLPDARFPLTLEYVRRHRNELLAALFLSDSESLSELTANAVACQAADILQIPLERQPVYMQSEANCVTSSSLTDDQVVFGDSACTEPLNTVDTSLNDFCDVALSSNRLGNAASDESTLQRWSLSPGNTFDIGSLSLTGMLQPWMQRVKYKTVFTERGECQLEMRIYTSHPSATDRTPVIAFHGGSWQHRGSGFLGIETTATQFVNSGFTVFAPFYRLIGTDDGNSECNNADVDAALADTQDALDWVLSNSERYGSVGKPVLFGQSAGGHLAASLAVNRSDDISRAILLYAPTDFRDFAEQIQQGQYTGRQGQRILQAVTGQSIDSLDLSSPLIANNSFPQIIAAQPDAYPPFYLLHGQSDSLLPYRQSVRLCNSLAGNPISGPAFINPDETDLRTVVNRTDLRTVVNCDSKGSELHLIQQGKHALDLCIAPELCFAGSPESRRETAESLKRMLQWAASPTLPLPEQSQETNTGTPLHLILLLLLFTLKQGHTKNYLRLGHMKYSQSRTVRF